MIVIGSDMAESYFADHVGHKGINVARSQYEAWLDIVTRAEWRNPGDVKASYPKASILKAGRVVFNIKGNDYRLVARVLAMRSSPAPERSSIGYGTRMTRPMLRDWRRKPASLPPMRSANGRAGRRARRISFVTSWINTASREATWCRSSARRAASAKFCAGKRG